MCVLTGERYVDVVCGFSWKFGGVSFLVMPFENLLRKIKINRLTAFFARKIGKALCGTVDQYIFVANTGRCGSQTLGKIFDSVEKCVSLHEPHPNLAGEVFREYNEFREDLFYKEFYQRKLPNIFWAAKGKKLYVETSNMFIKVYSDELVRVLGPKLKVINLYRDKNAVATSFYRRHAHSDNVKRDWILNPSAARNYLKMDDELGEGGKYSHPFFSYLWYCYEVEVRTKRLAKMNPNIQILDFQTENLNDIDAVKELMSELGMDVPSNLAEILGVKHNASPNKPEFPPEISHTLVDEFHELCNEKISNLKLN